MESEDIWILVKLIGGLVIGLMLLVFGIQSCYINVVNTVPVRAYVDGILIYEGKSGCINVSSAGRTTALTVNGGFLCFYPQKEYVSDNVKVEGIK